MIWFLLANAAAAEDLVVILPGLGDSKKGRKEMAAWGDSLPGYTVVVPDYIPRDSVQHSTENLAEFFEQTDTSAYEEVHVFAYIMGTWSLNLYLQEHEIPGLRSVVYDRSPIQERAPSVVHRRIRCLTRVMFGPILGDLAGIAYPTYQAPEGVNTGLVIENRATSLMRTFKGTVEDMGPVTWDLDQFEHESDDAFYTWVNHDEMYLNFETIGPELLYFFENGRFTEGAQREPSELDPWRKDP